MKMTIRLLARRATALLVAGVVVVQPAAAQVGRISPLRPLSVIASAPIVVSAPAVLAPAASILSASPALPLPLSAIHAAPMPAAAAPAAAVVATALPVARAAAAPVPLQEAPVPASAEAAAVEAARTFDAAGARAALEEAAQDDYSVTVLARRAEGRRQLVVLLGESHVKTPESARVGRRVLDRFKDYALEGYDAKGSWAGRLFWWYETKARAVTTAGLPGGVNAGSTIKEAVRLAAADPSLRRYDLEAGHRPGLAEKIGLLSPFVKMGAPFLLLGSLLAVPFVGGAGAALVAAGMANAYVFLSHSMPAEWILARPLGALFPLETGVIRGRDKTMARALSAAADSEQAGPIVAVIGRSHAPGMAKILAGKYGFQPASLSALQDESLPGPAPALGRLGRIAALTIDYYLLASWFVPKKAKTAIRAFLGRRVESFDPEEMSRRIAEAPGLLDARRFKRYWGEGKYLKAYQGFWSGWNPITQPLTREVYATLGGNAHPVLATLGTFLYSGLFIHGLNPLGWPFFLVMGLFGMWSTLLTVIAAQIVLYAALSLPIVWLKATGR